MPLAMELSGRCGPLAQRLFHLVAERARDLKGMRGSKYASFVGYWRRVMASSVILRALPYASTMLRWKGAILALRR